MLAHCYSDLSLNQPVCVMVMAELKKSHIVLNRWYRVLQSTDNTATAINYSRWKTVRFYIYLITTSNVLREFIFSFYNSIYGFD